MASVAFYVAILRKDEGGYVAYLPSINKEIPVKNPFAIQSDLQDDLGDKIKERKVILGSALTDGIMQVTNATKRYMKWKGINPDNFMDVVKVTLEV